MHNEYFCCIPAAVGRIIDNNGHFELFSRPHMSQMTPIHVDVNSPSADTSSCLFPWSSRVRIKEIWEDAIVGEEWIWNWLPEGEMKGRELNHFKCSSDSLAKISQITALEGGEGDKCLKLNIPWYWGVQILSRPSFCQALVNVREEIFVFLNKAVNVAFVVSSVRPLLKCEATAHAQMVFASHWACGRFPYCVFWYLSWDVNKTKQNQSVSKKTLKNAFFLEIFILIFKKERFRFIHI